MIQNVQVLFNYNVEATIFETIIKEKTMKRIYLLMGS